MLRVMFLEKVISFENSFNGILAGLRQLPVIGGMISENAFERNAAKKVLSCINFIVGLFVGFAGKLLYSVVFLLVPYIIMHRLAAGNTIHYEEAIINIFVMMNCICGSLIYTGILSDSEEDYMLVNVMRINPVKHYHGKLLFKAVTDAAFFLAVLCMLGIEFTVSLRLSAILFAARGIGEFLRLMVYDRFPALYEKAVIPDAAIIIVCVYFAYVSPCYQGILPGYDIFAMNTGIFTAVFAAGIAGLCLVWFYRGYDVLARRKLCFTDTVYDERIAARERIRAVKMEVLKNAVTQGRHEKKNGFAYLNAIFFDRYRRVIKKHIFNRIYIIVILCGAMSIWLYAGDDRLKSAVWQYISGLSVQLVIVMLLLSGGMLVCRTIYYNCDRMLLEFPYYRTQKAVTENFLCRVWRIILVDFCKAVWVCAALAVLVYYTGHIAEIQMVFPVMLEIAALSIFFSIYGTAVYHIFQPYNGQLKVKVELYNLCNALVIAAAIGINVLHTDTKGMLVLTIILDILGLAGAYLLVKRYGSENYKNK